MRIFTNLQVQPVTDRSLELKSNEPVDYERSLPSKPFPFVRNFLTFEPRFIEGSPPAEKRLYRFLPHQGHVAPIPKTIPRDLREKRSAQLSLIKLARWLFRSIASLFLFTLISSILRFVSLSREKK